MDASCNVLAFEMKLRLLLGASSSVPARSRPRGRGVGRLSTVERLLVGASSTTLVFEVEGGVGDGDGRSRPLYGSRRYGFSVVALRTEDCHEGGEGGKESDGFPSFCGDSAPSSPRQRRPQYERLPRGLFMAMTMKRECIIIRLPSTTLSIFNSTSYTSKGGCPFS